MRFLFICIVSFSHFLAFSQESEHFEWADSVSSLNKGVSNLRIIGYDNNYDGLDGDLILLYAKSKIQVGETFYLLNGVPTIDSVNRRTLFDDGLKGMRVRYNGDDNIDVGSVLCIKLKNDGDGNVLFDINGVDFSNFFEVEYDLGVQDAAYIAESPQLNRNEPGSLLLFRGKSFVYENRFDLVGNVITGIFQGYNSNDIDIFNSFYNFEREKLLFFPALNDGLVSLMCDDKVYDYCSSDSYLLESLNFDLVDRSVTDSSFFTDGSYSGLCSTLCGDGYCEKQKIEIFSRNNSDTINIAFLLDNSGSVNRITEYPLMKEAVISTIAFLNSNNLEVVYSVSQFANTGNFDVTLEPTSDIGELLDLQPAFVGGGTDVHSAFSSLHDYLLDTNSLEVHLESSSLNIVLLHDAYYNQMLPDTGNMIYPELKKEPFLATISVVRYDVDSIISDADMLSAGISSFGGEYLGGVTPVYGDPEISMLPRLFIKDTFSSSLDHLESELIRDELYLSAPNDCSPLVIEWSIDTSTSAEILEVDSLTGTLISTNGIGRYYVAIACENGCVLRDTFEYPNDTIGLRGHFVDENINSMLNIEVFPNPFMGKFFIALPEEYQESIGAKFHRVVLYDINGRIVFDKKITSSDNPLEIALYNATPGIYFGKIGERRFSVIKQ